MLGSNVTAYNPQAQRLYCTNFCGAPGLAGIGSGDFSKVFGLIERQATMLSYIDVFQLLALIFLLMIPLVLIMKKPSPGAKPVAAH